MSDAELEVIRDRCRHAAEKCMSLPSDATDLFGAYHADVSALLAEVERLRAELELLDGIRCPRTVELHQGPRRCDRARGHVGPCGVKLERLQ